MRRVNATFLIGLVVSCVAVFTHKADTKSTKIDKDGYILEWLILGPIRDTGDGAAAIKIDSIKKAGKGPAGDLQPREGDTMILGPKNEKLTWERINFQELVDTGDIPAPAVGGTNLDRKVWGGAAVDNACAYLVIYLFYKKGDKVEYFLGSDGTVKVWLNGEEIWFNEVKRAWGGDADKHSGTVEPNSWNTYTVQICETGGSWALTVKDLTGIDDVSTNPDVFPVDLSGKLPATWGFIKSKY